ncbi:GAD-like domain-containing protein, partial [Planococcus sp. SIMBA_143]
MEKVFSDFIKNEAVNKDIILKYRGEIPNELIEVWEKYGFGTLVNGFLKVINPEDYLDILEK